MNNDIKWKSGVTITLWTLMIGAMIALPITLQGTLGDDVIVFPILFTIAGVFVTGFIWVGSASEERRKEGEKDKRERLSHALRDLSDDELVRLRQRLSSGDVDEAWLARLIDESTAGKAKR